MSAESNTIPEELLLAYFEGALEPDEAARVSARLESDTAAQAQLADWEEQNAALQALFSPVAEEPVPPRLADIPHAARRSRRGPALQIAAMLAMLAIGGGGGWFAAQIGAHEPAPRTFAASAISAHETFVVEVAHPVEVGADQAEHLVRWISNRLGQDLAPPDLATFGFRLMGGRVLPANGSAAAMLMYENDLGRRISLYVVPPDDAAQTAFQFTEQDGFQSFYWMDRDLSYAIVGDIPRETLRSIALAAYDQLI